MVLYGSKCIPVQSAEVSGVSQVFLLVRCLLQASRIWWTLLHEEFDSNSAQTFSSDSARRPIQEHGQLDLGLWIVLAGDFQASVVGALKILESAVETNQGLVEERETGILSETTTA